MKIGVVSDTHLHGPSEELERVVEAYLKETDMILHAGDIVEKEVLDAFSGQKLKAVSGNMDSIEIKKVLPLKRVIEAGQFKIGLIHGSGSPVGIEKRIVKEFEDVDCIVFGHTHTPMNHLVGNVLLFNPGTMSNRWHDQEGSIGILELNEGIQGKIIRV